MQWDVFCHVVDNYGDIGVSWRLSADLAARGHGVRLWVDDPSALAWMAPHGAPRVQVLHWAHPLPEVEPGDVVVETFGCNPPPGFVARMQRPRPPLWINLEYLSAEDYAGRNHGLLSPQLAGPGAGLTKWFFYPGFTRTTGGLSREPGLMAERAAFDRHAWLASLGIDAAPGERIVSLFCYRNAALPHWLEQLSHRPTLLLLTPDRAAPQARAELGSGLTRGALRAFTLPYLAQPEFDRLLWAGDINFIRGEDSFVRAQWAGAPFVWHIYPQVDDVHALKLDAFLQRHLDGADAALARQVRDLWWHWNGLRAEPPPWPDETAWRAQAQHWTGRLAAQHDLVTRLLGFVSEKG